ncbi:unnamed protein product [Boreogadus saida]
MASTIRQVLQHSLEDLSKDELELKKFRARLLDREREGEPLVRRRALEDKDEIGIADVLAKLESMIMGHQTILYIGIQ